MAEQLQKQPWEERIYSFDFSPAMDADATLTSVDSIVVTLFNGVGSPSVVVSGEAVSGQAASAKLAGGTDGQVYTVRARVIDSTGQKLEADGKLKIKEL